MSSGVHLDKGGPSRGVRLDKDGPSRGLAQALPRDSTRRGRGGVGTVQKLPSSEPCRWIRGGGTRRGRGVWNETSAVRGIQLTHFGGRATFNSRGPSYPRIRGNYNRHLPSNALLSQLGDLITKDSDEVITIIAAHERAFEELLNKEYHHDSDKEQLITLVQILGDKLCGTSTLISQRNILIAKSCASSLLNQLKDLPLEVLEEQWTQEGHYSTSCQNGSSTNTIHRSPLKILHNLYQFCKFVTDKMPSQSPEHFIRLAANVNIGIGLLNSTTNSNPYFQSNFDGFGELNEKFLKLKTTMQEYKSKRDNVMTTSVGKSEAYSQRQLSAMEQIWRQPPPDNFRSIPIIPTPKELLSEEKVYLRPSLMQGKYPSAEDYMDVQFRLLREDFVSPLRDGIRDYFFIKEGKKKMTPGSVKVYSNVQLFPRLNFDKHTPYYMMKLDYKRNRYLRGIKWDKSKRLLNGNLLLLTNNNFENVYFATICTRDAKHLEVEGIFGIIWEDVKPVFCAESYFDVLECDVYFETYRHTLKALKEIELGDFPMAKYIVDADVSHKLPSYIQKIDKHVSFKTLIPGIEIEGEGGAENYDLADISDASTWPSADELGMDISQYKAFCAALTREISIIQGPPGTGKTFIGIQIAKFLLANQEYFFPQEITCPEVLLSGVSTPYDGCPVLIVCYTNHALDQFLEAVMEIMLKLGMNPKKEMIRVGGRTKSEAMKDLLLHTRLDVAKQERLLPHYFDQNLRSHRSNLNRVRAQRFKLMECLRVIKESTAILDLEAVFGSGSDFCFDFNLPTFCELEAIDVDLTPTEVMFSKLLAIMSRQSFGLVERIFGLNADDFYNENFSHNRWRKQIFGNRFHWKIHEKEKMVTALPAEAEVQGEDESEENYDLNELMASRIQEIEYEIDIDITSGSERYKPKYLIGSQGDLTKSSTPKLRSCLRYLEEAQATHAAGTESDDRNWPSLDYASYMYSQELEKVARQYSFIKYTIRDYHENNLMLAEFTESELNVIVTGMQKNDLPSPLETWTIYFQLLTKCKKGILKVIVKLEDELVKLDLQHKEVENSCYSLLLQQAKFVGMTTTGAAKYNSLVRKMKSKLVIVEEAAEVLESHVMACLTKHCEHLILIGDHKQLRPKTSVYKLAKQYNLDISLFERMTNNNLNLYRLEVQHRMRAEICDLLVPTIYDRLENHESVFEYPEVTGVESNLFFISHKEKETDETDSTSKSNLHEATFLVRLCRHFRLQGYSSDRITIITTYIGQMFLTKKIMWKDEMCRDVRVTVVDNFQGEENDIILLSLVRSNDDNKIGFLKTENRICVALSRAKHGFYVIGNMDSMTSASSTWKTIMDKLTLNDKVGAQLSLKCQIHRDVIPVMTSADFDKAPEGGCSRMCETELRCGHSCQLVCHILDKDHVEYKCRLPCDKKCEKREHRCPRDCYELCPRCSTSVDILLGCGHQTTLQCYVDETTHLCTVKVIKRLPCAHEKRMKCHENPATISCEVQIVKELPCGHQQKANCCTKPEAIQCTSKIEVEIPACEHLHEIMCFQKNKPNTWMCKKDCDTRLECGHACAKICHAEKDPNHENYNCRKDCARSCHNGHKCGEGLVHNHKCHSICPNCEVLVKITLKCGHEAEVSCFASLYPSAVRCNVRVMKPSIDCSHSFVVSCAEPAAKLKCEELVVSQAASLCGHDVKVACRIQDTVTPEELLTYCQRPCEAELIQDGVGCRHRCMGSCSRCFRGKLHQKCTEKCGRVLICGHVCNHPCSAICPPCQKTCELRCKHSKCKSKCGVPCSTCKEPCEWACEHKSCTNLCGEQCNRPACNVSCPLTLTCGHPCVGLCSEPCPPKCRVCDGNELKEIFFGNEDEADVRFVYLLDCKHTLEVNGLDKWILGGSTGSTKDTVQVKKCPKCSTTIRTSLRYGSILKASYSDVIRVKNQIFGKQDHTQKELSGLVTRLQILTSSFPASLFFFAVYISQQIFQNDFNPFLMNMDKKIRKPVSTKIKKVDQYVLESLMNFVAWCEHASVNLFQPSPDDHKRPFQRFGNQNHSRSTSNQQGISKPSLSLAYSTDLSKRYIKLLTVITKRELPLSHLEIMQLSLEFKRLSDLFQLYRRYSVEYFTKFNVERKCDEVKKILLLDATIYNKSSQLTFKKYLQEIDCLMKSSLPVISRDTVLSIFKAVGFGGSWYKCPNGHIYSIGNCGQPSETARCPDCNATIGASRYHESAAGNVRIAEINEAPPVELIPTPDFLH